MITYINFLLLIRVFGCCLQRLAYHNLGQMSNSNLRAEPHVRKAASDSRASNKSNTIIRWQISSSGRPNFSALSLACRTGDFHPQPFAGVYYKSRDVHRWSKATPRHVRPLLRYHWEHLCRQQLHSRGSLPI